jgi:hypothetical protein
MAKKIAGKFIDDGCFVAAGHIHHHGCVRPSTSPSTSLAKVNMPWMDGLLRTNLPYLSIITDRPTSNSLASISIKNPCLLYRGQALIGREQSKGT